jgi:hypothetical protein
MKRQFSRYKLHLLFILIGIVAGYIYWYYIGCQSGTCPLTSIWYYHAGIGGLGGYIMADIVVDIKKKRTDKKDNNLS